MVKGVKQCIDPTTKKLPSLPTTMGDTDMKDVIKNVNNLIIIDGLCYDIKELYELIKVDISQGNIWAGQVMERHFQQKNIMLLHLNSHIKELCRHQEKLLYFLKQKNLKNL
jgi:hypothetical protein